MVTPFAEGSLLRIAHKATPADIDTLTAGGNVMVLTPHPDDESLGCGAAIAAASEHGAKIAVVAVTDGRGSHPRSLLFPPEKLAAERATELKRAVHILTKGLGTVTTLNYPDQNAPSTIEDVATACYRLVPLMDDLMPSALWSTWRYDPHVDHQRTAQIALHLLSRNPTLTLLFYPIWGRFTEASIAASETLYRFDTNSLREVKQEAILCHRSQMTKMISDDPQGFVMDDITRQHFIDSPELFISRGLS